VWLVGLNGCCRRRPTFLIWASSAIVGQIISVEKSEAKGPEILKEIEN